VNRREPRAWALHFLIDMRRRHASTNFVIDIAEKCRA
jgi:hypothetical protein